MDAESYLYLGIAIGVVMTYVGLSAIIVYAALVVAGRQDDAMREDFYD